MIYAGYQITISALAIIDQARTAIEVQSTNNKMIVKLQEDLKKLTNKSDAISEPMIPSASLPSEQSAIDETKDSLQEITSNKAKNNTPKTTVETTSEDGDQSN